MKITYERPDYCTGCNLGKLQIKHTNLYGDNECSTITTLECEHDELCQQFYERIYERIVKVQKITPYEASYWPVPCAHCKSLSESEQCYACLTDDKNGLGKTRFTYDEYQPKTIGAYWIINERPVDGQLMEARCSVCGYRHAFVYRLGHAIHDLPDLCPKCHRLMLLKEEGIK